MQNGWLEIPYYQQFIEIPRHQITKKRGREEKKESRKRKEGIHIFFKNLNLSSHPASSIYVYQLSQGLGPQWGQQTRGGMKSFVWLCPVIPAAVLYRKVPMICFFLFYSTLTSTSTFLFTIPGIGIFFPASFDPDHKNSSIGVWFLQTRRCL